jgi:hypothetical protein
MFFWGLQRALNPGNLPISNQSPPAFSSLAVSFQDIGSRFTNRDIVP